MPDLGWNLLEEVLQIERGQRARALGRLPECDVSPEWLMVEMMAQTAGLAFGSVFDFNSDVVFAKMAEASFDFLPAAGAGLEIEASAEELREEGCWFQAKISVQGRPAAEARLMLLNAGRLRPASGRSITFHENFMKHYRILEKIVSPARQTP